MSQAGYPKGSSMPQRTRTDSRGCHGEPTLIYLYIIIRVDICIYLPLLKVSRHDSTANSFNFNCLTLLYELFFFHFFQGL